jgi:hypothetical protein
MYWVAWEMKKDPDEIMEWDSNKYNRVLAFLQLKKKREQKRGR